MLTRQLALFLLLLYGPALFLLIKMPDFGWHVQWGTPKPSIGDCLSAAVLLCVGWLLAAVLLALSQSSEATRIDRRVGVAMLATHGLLLCAGWAAGLKATSATAAEHTVGFLAAQVPPAWDMRRRWRVVGSGLLKLSLVGMAPAQKAAEGIVCDRMVRMGGLGLLGTADGSKMVCLDALQSKAHCVVVSVGCNGDFTFEEAVHAAYPHCTVHVFDGTMAGRTGFAGPPSWLAPTFHYRNFDAKSYILFAGIHVSILKMDCEGCEFRALLPFLRHACVDQVLLELHGGPRRSLLDSVNASHGVFYVEPNFGTTGCLELGLLRRDVRVCNTPPVLPVGAVPPPGRKQARHYSRKPSGGAGVGGEAP